MPWNSRDARGKTKRANTPAKQRQWKDVANSIRERTGDDARAIRGANSAVRKHPSRKRK